MKTLWRRLGTTGWISGRMLLTAMIGLSGSFALTVQADDNLQVTMMTLSVNKAIPHPSSTTQPLPSGMRDKPVTMPETASLSSMIMESAANPEEICRRVSAQVKYEPDTKQEDEWREPAQTLKMGRGDCEDFATCVSTVSAAKGLLVQVYILTSRVNKLSHAITISENSGKMWMSSNGTYVAVLSQSDAKDRICRNMGWAYDDVTMTETRM